MTACPPHQVEGIALRCCAVRADGRRCGRTVAHVPLPGYTVTFVRVADRTEPDGSAWVHCNHCRRWTAYRLTVKPEVLRQ